MPVSNAFQASGAGCFLCTFCASVSLRQCQSALDSVELSDDPRSRVSNCKCCGWHSTVCVLSTAACTQPWCLNRTLRNSSFFFLAVATCACFERLFNLQVQFLCFVSLRQCQSALGSVELSDDPRSRVSNRKCCGWHSTVCVLSTAACTQPWCLNRKWISSFCSLGHHAC